MYKPTVSVHSSHTPIYEDSQATMELPPAIIAHAEAAAANNQVDPKAPYIVNRNHMQPEKGYALSSAAGNSDLCVPSD